MGKLFEMPWSRAGGVFPTKPDVENMLGRTNSDFDKFHVCILLDPIFADSIIPDF